MQPSQHGRPRITPSSTISGVQQSLMLNNLPQQTRKPASRNQKPHDLGIGRAGERQPLHERMTSDETAHDVSAQSNRREHSRSTENGNSLHSSDTSASGTPTGASVGVYEVRLLLGLSISKGRSGRSTDQWDRRLLSYVRKKAEASDGSAEAGSTSEHNLAVEVASRKAVCAYEKARGRVADQMPQTHPGYDIISRNPLTGEERFIEVKGVSGKSKSTRCRSVAAPVQQCSGLW